MNVTFLGTGTSQGIPVIACQCEICKSADPRDNRLRSSILIEHGNTNIVIDSGPDFRQQMLRADVKSLDAILFTHEHKDHVAGMDDIRSYNYLQGKPMEIFAEERVLYALEREFLYVFAENKYPGIPEVNLNKIRPGTPFTFDDIPILPFRVMHYRLPIIGYRIKKFAYITDANSIEDHVFDALKGIDILVLNALRYKKHISHFNLQEALEVIKIINPKKAYLTHLSHKFDTHSKIQEQLPLNVFVAYDGLKIII